MFGPYATEAAAIADARDVLDLSPVGHQWDAGNAVKLHEACRTAGVELGIYDERIVEFLSRWEPQVVQVIAGWIVRAGRVQEPADRIPSGSEPAPATRGSASDQPSRQVFVDDKETGQIHKVETRDRDQWLEPAGREAAVKPAPRSAKVEAIREAWRIALRDRVHVGDGQWTALADCSYEDLIFAARECRDRARRNIEQADRLSVLAGLLQRHECQHVVDLPDDVLRDHLGGAS